MNTSLRDLALDSWGDPTHYDRNDPFPLFAQVRAKGPVHEVRLAEMQIDRTFVHGRERARALDNPQDGAN